MVPIKPHWLNYIDGEWCDNERRIAVNNPATGAPLATVAGVGSTLRKLLTT